MLTIIALPTNFTASTTAVAADFVNDLSAYIYLILGVILALVIVEVIIGAIRKT